MFSYYIMQIPFELYNKTNGLIKAQINANQKIAVFQSNLLSKQLYISTLNFSDTTIPKFIPEYVHGPLSYFKQSVAEFVNPVNTQTYGNFPLINTTPYYVLCSFEESPGHVNYYLKFVSHLPNVNATAPAFYPETQMSYYENNYYYYNDFSKFVKQVSNALAEIVNDMASLLQIQYSGSSFYITTSDNSMTFNVNETIYNASGENIKLYMSNNLATLLNLNAVSQNNNMFSEIKLEISAGDYMTLETPTDMSKICPVKQILIDSNLPVENVIFYSNNNAPNVIEERKTILMLFYTPSTIMQSSNVASYNVGMPIPYIYFNVDQWHNQNYAEFNIFLRLTNGIVIQHMLETNGYINLVFRLEKK